MCHEKRVQKVKSLEKPTQECMGRDEEEMKMRFEKETE